MADDLGTVGIVWAELGLRADAYNVGMATAARTAETTATKITRTMTRLAGAGVGLYAITKGIKEVVDAFVSFDRELHNIWTLTDYTAEKMQQLGAELRAVAREYNVTATQAAKAMYQIYSAVFYGADAMKILEASLKGAAAGLSDVFTAADMTTTVLNAYRMSAEKATYVNDLLFTSVRFGKTTYGELAGQFGRLAGIAAPVGASVKEMTAAIATLTRQGIQTDWAVTSLRQTLQQILRPGKELQDVISALGYVSGRAMMEAHGFSESLGLIASYADSAGIGMEELFSNVRAVTAVLPLATTAAGEFRKDLRRMEDSAGAMQTAFEKAAQSWSYQLSVLKTHLQDTAISMGKIFLPAIKSVLDIVLLLSKGFALISEALVAIGGAHALAAIAVLGSVFALYKVGSVAIMKANAALLAWIASAKAATGATAELAAATAALNWQWATTSTAAPAAAVATTGAAGVMGGIRGALAKGVGGMTPLTLLGTGLAAMLGTGMAIQGALQLNIALKAAVTGEGEVKMAVTDALQAALGPVIAGAAIAKLFGASAALGAGIGFGVAAAAVLSIYIYHIVKQAAATQEARREILRGTMAEAVGLLPERISAGEEPMRALFDQLRQLNPEIEDTTEFFNALRDVMGDMYEMDYAGFFKSVDWVMEEQYERMKAVSSALGVILDPEDIESMAADWKERLMMAVMDGLTGIPEAVARFMPTMLKEELAELETKSIADLTKEEMASFLGFLVDEVRGWAESIEGVSLEAATAALQKFFGAIDEIARAQTLSQAAAGIKRWQESFKGLVDEMTSEQRFALFQRIIATWADEMVATYATALGEAIGVPMESVAEIINEILNPAAEAAAAAIPSVAEQLETVREEFYELLGEITAGDITLDQASEKWDELKKKVSDLEDPLEMAEALNLDYADALRDVYDELQAAIGAAENAAGAVQAFTDALNAVALAAGARQGLESLFAGMEERLLRSTTVGEAAELIAGIVSGGGTIEGLQVNLERIFGPGSTFTTAAQEWAREMHSLVSNTFPEFGMSLEEVAAEAERLAEQQRRDAEEAAREAERAAEEAYRAEQEAFRDSFLAPIEAAVRTGDFMGAAEQVRAMTENFADLVNQGAALDMTALDVLGMLSSAKGQIGSTIDGLIELNAHNTELVEALEYARDRINEFFTPVSALEAQLREITRSDLLTDPAGTAVRLKALAEEDFAAVSAYAKELATSIQTDIDAMGYFGLGTGRAEDILRQFNEALAGAPTALDRFVSALDHYSSVIDEIINFLLPSGMAGVASKMFDAIKAILAGRSGAVMLAEGGLVTGPTFSVLGEKEPELVVPLSQLNLRPLEGATFGATTPSPFSGTPGQTFGQTFSAADTSGLSEAVDSVSNAITALAQAIEWGALEIHASLGAAAAFFRADFGTPAVDVGTFAVPEEPKVFETTMPESSIEIQQSLAGTAKTMESMMAEFRQTAQGMIANQRVEAVALAEAPTAAIAETASLASEIASAVKEGVSASLATALDVLNITPQLVRGEAEAKTPVGGEAADLAKKIGIIGAVASAVIELLKYIKSLADEGIAMMNEAVKEAASIVRSVFGDLATAATRLAQNFTTLIASTETYGRLQASLAAFQSKIFDALMGWAWPLIAIFEKLTGTVDETIDSFNSLNVPTGYKVTRAEWKAATPGEPGERKTGGGAELPEWVTDLIEKFKDAIGSVIEVFQSFFDIMSDIWAELGPIILDGILPSLQAFGERLVELGQRIQENVLPALKEHLAGTIQGFLDFFFGSIEGAATFFVDTLAVILPNLELFAESIGLLGGTLPALAAALSDALSPAINTLLEGMTLLAGWLTETMIPGLEELLVGFGKFWETEVGPLFTEKVFPQILEWATKVYDFISDKVVPFFENTLWPFMENTIWPTFTEIVDGVIGALKTMWDDIEENAGPLLDFVKGLLEDWGDKVIGGIETVNAMTLAKTGDFLGALDVIWQSESLGLWDQIKLSFGVGLMQIVAACGRLWEAMEPVVGPVLQLLGGALYGVLVVVAAAFDALAYIVNLILAPFKALYNIIVWLHNLFSSKENDWEYAEYAEGGIVTKPTLALIGEDGPEAVVPLSRGLPTAESIALGGSHAAYAGAAAGSGDLYYQHTSVVQIGGRTILREVDRERRHMDKLRSGTAAGRRWERG